MPLQLYNAASDIIAALQQGIAERRQQEQDQLAKETDARDFQEKQRQFDERQKQAQQEADLRLKDFEANEKARQAALNFQKEQYKLNVRRAMLAGEIPIPGQVVKENWAEQNAPEKFVPRDFTNESLGVTIPASEMPDLSHYMEVQRALDSAKGAGEFERAQTIAKINADARAASDASREEIAAKNWDNRMLLQQNSLNAMMDRLGLSLANRQNPGDRRDRSAVVGVADKIKSDPMYKKWQGTNDAYNFVTKNIPDVNAPGINDMHLIYMWVKGLDESVVRPSEFETVQQYGVPWLESKKLQFKRLSNNTVIIPPATRMAIINDIKSTYRSRGVEWNKLLDAARSRAKYLDPDVKDEDFNNLIYSGVYKEPTSSMPPGVVEMRRVK